MKKTKNRVKKEKHKDVDLKKLVKRESVTRLAHLSRKMGKHASKKSEKESEASKPVGLKEKAEIVKEKFETNQSSPTAASVNYEKMGILEKYDIEADYVKTTVHITGGQRKVPKYFLVIPEIQPATKVLLEEIRHELVTQVTMTISEILDPKEVNALKEKFRLKANLLLLEKLPNLEESTKAYLVGILLHEMVGLGDIEFLLNDGLLEEIVVNSATEFIRVYHKKYGWLETNIMPKTESQIQNFSNVIARRVGRQITTLNPLLDAHLVSGDRANAVLYPISNKGHTITIRKFARDPWTVIDLINNKTSSSNIFALIWLAMQYEMNTLISGGTGSGKTSFLNAIMPFVPPNHRIISIEDTRELQLPKYLYWCPLTTRQPNPEGKGEITMLDLLINSLRMRPDRIILGEMRRKSEAEVLFEAMHTGHSVYATVHADSISETISRLTNPPIEVPPNLLAAVNLIVVMFRDRRKGFRKTFQIGEFITSEESGQITVKPNILFRWKPATDSIVPHADSLRFFEDLSRHTGMSQYEMNKDLENKEAILKYLIKHNLRSITEVGKVLNEYYLDQEYVVQHVHKNGDPAILLK
jgi:flagellar protein FlaI